MKLKKVVISVIWMTFGASAFASPADLDNFSCEIDFFGGVFIKNGAKAVFTFNNTFSNSLQVEEYHCETGVMMKFQDHMFCYRTVNYEGVARSTTHLVFQDSFSSLIMSRSDFTPNNEVAGDAINFLEANCQ